MIKEMTNMPEGVLGIRLSGKISGDDYEQVLTPAVNRVIEEHVRIRLLAELGADFESYSLDAAWEDSKLGIKHWKGFERAAIVTDIKWVTTAMKAMGFMLPCPIKTFPLNERENAKRWLSESFGSIRIDANANLVKAQLIGQLEPSAYDHANADIDHAMSQSDDVRLLLDLREFDGWSGLSAISDHVTLVKQHHKVPRKIAIVGNKTWQKMAEKVVGTFTKGETQFFNAGDYDQAVQWAND